MKLTRRDFNRLTSTAFGGVLAGSLIGCGGNNDDTGTADTVGGGGAPTTDSSMADSSTADRTATGDDSPANGEQKLVGAELPEHNACLGLNQCKEYGKNAGEHTCAGQSSCATVSHECRTKNSCKYLGACDGKVGANQCKQQGGCQVPMTAGDEIWQQARAAFEKRMKEKGTEVGMAPLS